VIAADQDEATRSCHDRSHDHDRRHERDEHAEHDMHVPGGRTEGAPAGQRELQRDGREEAVQADLV
jgi:hypothetical protein